MKDALIIFTRNPVLGKVKTRIAEAVGEKEALGIYKALLQHTHDISTAVDADRYVFYSDHIQLGDLWKDNRYHKFLQAGQTLGSKMQDAFSRMFAKGYGKAVIIGSDCYELTADILKKAFEGLNTNDAVIGPAKDGGYYLLGMKKLITEIFENKKWSTASVYSETISDLEKAGFSYATLPLLNDVDRVEDVPEKLFNWKKIS
ncbi:MAG: TIGR04282 family arsenosugar biosynthesis glycosyltransferase [Bacteroidota bacterium]